MDALPVPPVLLAMTWVEAGVLLLTGFGLFVTPAALDDLWPWKLSPFNARFLGAIYLAALAAIATLLWRPRWVPARLLAPMILTFTAVVFAVSVATADRFRGGNAAWMTVAWFTLYLVLPLNAGWHVWRYRSRGLWGGLALTGLWSGYLRAMALVFGTYGLAMLLTGNAATGFWPWPIDDFHARIYSAMFLTGAVGGWTLAAGGTAVEVVMVGLLQATLGALSVVGLIVVDRSANRVEWGDGGTWLWVGWFGATAVAGVALAIRGIRAGAP